MNQFFNPSSVVAAQARHEASLVPQRARFAAALSQCGSGTTPAQVARAMFAPGAYPLEDANPVIFLNAQEIAWAEEFQASEEIAA